MISRRAATALLAALGACGGPLVVDLRSGDTGPAAPGWAVTGTATVTDVGAGGAVVVAQGGPLGVDLIVVGARGASGEDPVGAFVLDRDQGSMPLPFDAGLGAAWLDAGDAARVLAVSPGAAAVLLGAPGRASGGQAGAGALQQLQLDDVAHGGSPALGASVSSDEAGAGFGAALSFGDPDGDGVLDTIVAAPGARDDAGRLALFDGTDPAAWGAPADAPVRPHGADPGDRLGTALSLSGDLDGDGADDLVACAPGRDLQRDDGGGCSVVPGAALLAAGDGALWHQSAAALLGDSGDALGGEPGGLTVADLDGDGQDDVAVALPGRPGGAVAVFLGPIGDGLVDLDDAHALLAGDGRAGAALAHRAGLPGLLVGAPDAGDATQGVARWLADLPAGRSTLAELPEHAWTGDAPGRALGAGLTVTGDDLLLVAPGGAGWVGWVDLEGLDR